MDPARGGGGEEGGGKEGVAKDGAGEGAPPGDGGTGDEDAFDGETPDSNSGTGDAGCKTGTVQCSGQQPQSCASTGQWQNSGASCSGATPVCTVGGCAALPPSCSGGEAGLTCGSGDSCCTSLEVTGAPSLGTYYRTYTSD